MAIANRDEFKEYCLRALGKPVIKVDVEDTQAEDRIDEALKKFAKYHYDGAQRIFYKHAIQQTDRENRYITLPDNILGVVKVYPMHGQTINGSGMFDIRYQIAMNDMYYLATASLVPYYMTMTHINTLSEMLVGTPPIRYSRINQKLHLDIDWEKYENDHYVMIEAFEVFDPDIFATIWEDIWLKEYTIALMKRQWGINLSKFPNMQLPQGVTVNGPQMYQDATVEIAKLNEELKNDYMMPVLDRLA